MTGVRVLDLTRLLPGPFCTLLLRRLGADVVKIEPPSGGDWVRYLPPQVDGRSALFDALNAGKRGLTLDLKHPDGPGVLRRLARSADVLVEGFRPGVMDRLGVGYETLREDNPALVWCAITGYGQDGPLKRRAGHDLNYVALAGLLGLNGDAGGPPRPPGVQMADLAGGSLTAVVGILAALLDARRSGEGRFVDVSMTEGALQLILSPLVQHLAGQTTQRGEGMLDGGAACYGVYETQDGGHLALGALEPQFWAAFCVAAGRPDLIARQQADAGPGGALQQEVATVVRSRTRAQWEEALAGVDACAEPVLALDEVASHPQHVARGVFLRDGDRTQVAVGPRFAGEPPELLPSSPEPGAHTVAVLAEAGLSEAEIAALQAAGAVA